MNECIKQGKVPKDWKTALLVPLYKGKGDHSDCNSYRAISLLSVPGKVFCKIVNRRKLEVTDSKVSDMQCGFRGGRSCVDQIFSIRMLLKNV